MPIRFIKIPEPIIIKDPFTNSVMKTVDGEDERLSFEEFLQKLMHNPMWAESYANMKAQSDIWLAWDSRKMSPQIMMLGEEEWLKLKQAVEQPRFEVIMTATGGSQIRPGIGFHPIMSRQLVPMMQAIVDASTNPQ